MADGSDLCFITFAVGRISTTWALIQ